MDSYEATRIVLSRIQTIDPENASKIMGLLLIQDYGEKEMIRLAFGPEALLHSFVLKARNELGLAASNFPSSTPSTPSPFNHHHHHSLSRQNSLSSSSSSRTNLPSPLRIPSQSNSSWAATSNYFSDFQSNDDLIIPNTSTSSFSVVTSNGMNSSASPFYGSRGTTYDHLSFINDGLPNLSPNSHDLFYPNQDLASSPAGDYGGDSASDIYYGADDPSCGFGWKPCLYYARGYCKNGNSCRFLHGGGVADSAAVDGGVGSPGKLDMMENCQELLRSKSAQQQRFKAASQLLTSSSFPYSAAAPTKCVNFLLQQQQQQSDTQRAAAALMMGDDMHKFGRSWLERNDFPMNGGPGMLNAVSRQIYLTFPADSTFREEDVSNYFSIYGPVQDVRIPYQQKRMFGFVTFVYPETVKLILSKGNPHFVCDARVLVKPYKEKGKVPDKYRKQQMDRGEFSACGSPTGFDSRDPFDLEPGARIFCNTQDMPWRRKLEEQAELQQAIDFQGRRLMGLQLLDLKRHNQDHTLSTVAAIPSPTHSPNFFTQTLVSSSNGSSPEIIEEMKKVMRMDYFVAENGSDHTMAVPAAVLAYQELQQTVNVTVKEKELSIANGDDENGNGKESPHQHEESDLPESMEHNLPDSLFASPKAAGDYMTAFNTAGEAAKANAVASAASSANNNLMISSSSLLPTTSTLDVASFKSCYFQVPRSHSGSLLAKEPLECSSGPACPVGL